MRLNTNIKFIRLRKILFFLSLFFLSGLSLYGQAPDSIKYQAVVRDVSGNPITNRKVGVKISIVKNTDVVYVYENIDTTDKNGHVDLMIGSSEAFDTIAWSNGVFYLKRQFDPNGGTNYTISENSEILSSVFVQFAYLSDTARTAPSFLPEDSVQITGYGLSVDSDGHFRWDSLLSLPSTSGISDLKYLAIDTADSYYWATGIDLPTSVTSETFLLRSSDGSFTTKNILPSGGTSGQVIAGDGSGGTSFSTPVVASTPTEGLPYLNYSSNSYSWKSYDTIVTGGREGQIYTNLGAGNFGWINIGDGVYTKSSSDLGGKVVYLTDNGRHGLVVANIDQSSSSSWFEAFEVVNDPNKHDFEGRKFTDWRLPTFSEMILINENGMLNEGIDNYWTSSEDPSDAVNAKYYNGTTTAQMAFKKIKFKVRAVRSF